MNSLGEPFLEDAMSDLMAVDDSPEMEGLMSTRPDFRFEEDPVPLLGSGFATGDRSGGEDVDVEGEAVFDDSCGMKRIMPLCVAR